MTDWGPATEVEAAMRDALNSSDQELYFRVLARTEVLLPVSAEALAGRAPMGWGTWTTSNRTHVLAFTSPESLFTCLNEPGGSYRMLPFHRLAAEWPNYEWWLAVNPGLPIEAYLPSWFVAQLTRGEVRLPGRTMGARARIAQGDLAAALGGRGRATGPMPPVSAPIPTQIASTVVAGVETVDAEIVDYPPVTASARVYTASATVAPAAPGYANPAPAYPGPAAPSHPAPPPPGYANPTAPRYPDDAGYPQTGYPQTHGGDYSGPTGPIDSTIVEPPYRTESAYRTEPAYRPEPAYRTEPAYRPDPAYRTEPVYPAEPAYRTERPAEPAYRAEPGYRAEPPLDHAYADQPYRAEASRFAASAASFAPPTVPMSPPPPSSPPPATGFGGHTYTVYEPEEPVFVDPDATSRIMATPPSAPSLATNRPPVRETEDAVIVPAPGPLAIEFVPANETESNLLAAVLENNNDAFLSTLLLARVIVPVPAGTSNGIRPRDPSFPWQIETGDGQRFIAVFTSPERLEEHRPSRFSSTVSLRFVQLIGAWPDEHIAFAINPGSPVGAILPGSEIIALASWATEVGLRDEPSGDVVVAAKKNEATPVLGVAGAPANGADRATVMQRTVPHAQVPFYLERGYDRVSGFVNRASEVAHLNAPRSLYKALGLVYTGSPFADDDAEVHVVRWVAHRAELYRLPYGGQHEAGMRAMQGWVIERPPFRGNGFAPGETEVLSEFKVDSVRLPHGAQMWRLAKDGSETLVATFDADSARWVSGPLIGSARA
jgi:hypothetical protein